MSSYEKSSHSFIVRIWCEPQEAMWKAPIWRGTIEHVGSGDREYLTDLDTMVKFITPYLEEMGIRPTQRWWLRRRRRR